MVFRNLYARLIFNSTQAGKKFSMRYKIRIEISYTLNEMSKRGEILIKSIFLNNTNHFDPYYPCGKLLKDSGIIDESEFYATEQFKNELFLSREHDKLIKLEFFRFTKRIVTFQFQTQANS